VRLISSINRIKFCLGTLLSRHIVGIQVPAVIFDGLDIQQNPKREVSGANPWPHCCGLFSNSLGVCALGHHLLMDLNDGEANIGSLRISGRIGADLRQKPWGGVDPSADLI
jgi:hypothetical protein